MHISTEMSLKKSNMTRMVLKVLFIYLFYTYHQKEHFSLAQIYYQIMCGDMWLNLEGL